MQSSETTGARRSVSSPRLNRLTQKMGERDYRHGYVATHTRQFLAKQMRSFRGDTSQIQFGKRLEKPQSVVSRLEDPNYGKWTLQTLFDVARKLDVAVIVRFVDFPTFLKLSGDMSEHAAHPPEFNAVEMDRVAAETEAHGSMALHGFSARAETARHQRDYKPLTMPYRDRPLESKTFAQVIRDSQFGAQDGGHLVAQDNEPQPMRRLAQ